MACILVALGLMPFAGATAPAVSAARLRVAEETGARAVELTRTKLTTQTILSRESFLNAITVLQAIGGSTNAIVHLMAIAGRHPTVAGSINLKTIDDVGRLVPMIVDLKPSGDGYMTDLHNSGGMLAVLHELKPLLHLGALTVTGRTLGEELARSPFKPWSPGPGRLTTCVRTREIPVYPSSSLVVLRGNLAPNGAVMKASAAKDRRLLSHSGPAVVFSGSADLAQRIDSPDLDVKPDSVLVLQNIGPVGNPGMPEAGLIPIPRKLAAQGVQDMLRISDGRMSGTAGGSIVLHTSPEAANPGSVLGIVRNGDTIICDVEKRLLCVQLSNEEIQSRISHQVAQEQLRARANNPSGPTSLRGYRSLYLSTVNQAELGADLNFLTHAGADAK
jgi:dihydroxy-acid dehydratase